MEPRVLLSTRVKPRTMRLIKREAKRQELTPSAYVAFVLDQYFTVKTLGDLAEQVKQRFASKE
jgi:hypothetical protein